MSENNLQVSNLWARYEKSKDWILKEINFNLERGEFILVTGKSGSGKTTLARCLLGLFPFFYQGEIKGKINIFGQNPLKGPSEVFGTVAFVSQQPKYYTIATSVREELIVPLENLGLSKKRIFSRVEDIVNQFEMTKLMKKPITEISSGELQKIAISSALSMKPKVLVFDEPLARLDRYSTVKIAQILEDLADKNITIILFEHHLDQILPLADKIFLLEKGKLKKISGSKDLIQLFEKVDLPEISETFLTLREQGKVEEIPTTIEEAIEIIQERLKC